MYKNMHRLLSREQMLKLNTKRLLAYRNSLYKYPVYSDYAVCKLCLEYMETVETLKAILATREHVARKPRSR